MADIKQGDHTFYIGDQQHPKAEVTFKEAGGAWDIDHTYVSDDMRGSGIGGQLVEKVVAHARENGMKLKATCPFAKQIIEDTPAYQDVLAE
ncbi:GNAT family N-acetyltransferase [Barrientosiimonas marina]|uniref:GNAT family N-acetyltransferase n=1 Tax=Lentibacillus kimchii TaxID=1542911 RepID=A0ABW2UV87_9BACI